MDRPTNRREMWTRIGYIATAAWMIVILAITNADAGDPLFQFIFIVPLSGWVLAIIIVRIVAHVRSQRALRRRRR